MPRIQLVRRDGTGDLPLLEPAVVGAQEKPDWSPDGRRITFRAEDSDGTLDIWVVDIGGANAERIVDCRAPCAWADDPAWSPDGSSIAFQQGTATGSSGLGTGSLEVVDVATRTQRTVFSSEPTEYVFGPRWSPDGTEIVLELDRFDSARLDASVVTATTIGTVNVGTKLAQFTAVLPWGTGASAPDWNRASGRLVFVLTRGSGSNEELMTMDRAGAGQARVTNVSASGGHAIQPTWTPDGTQIIFIIEDVPGRDPAIAFVDPTGSAVIRLPPGPLRTHPRLRPGG